MNNDEMKPTANVGYAFGQWLKAFLGIGEADGTKARQWHQVFRGMLRGTLKVGSRIPVEDVPAWVTLQVIHGGFATGHFMAGGPILPHEKNILLRLNHGPEETDRTPLNLFYTSPQGQDELLHMMREGTFRADVPEELALAVVAWLRAHGEDGQADALLDELSAFFQKLRFYPRPHDRPIQLDGTVCMQTAGVTRQALEKKRLNEDMARMREAILVWQPLYDGTVALFLETVEGPMPTPATDAQREGIFGPAEEVAELGGWPLRTFPPGWSDRGTELLANYNELRKSHRLCKKPEKVKENFFLLRKYLEICLKGPDLLTGREVGMLRKILVNYIAKHGVPGSPQHVALRRAQVAAASAPLHHFLYQTVARRLADLPQDEGLADVSSVLHPITEKESEIGNCPQGTHLPPALEAKLQRMWEGPVEALVEKGLVPSAEAIAILIPGLTATVLGTQFPDHVLRTMMQSTYRAFRLRRSLLLLNLEGQVQFHELPWVSAAIKKESATVATHDIARETLVQVSILTFKSFPQTILPNPLRREFSALAAQAKLDLPLVDELAADIFMGAFSSKFLKTAKLAAHLMMDTVYARYYDYPVNAILSLDDVEKGEWGASHSPGFAKMCAERAGVSVGGWDVAANGKVIEQSQILTTHNLATLFGGLGLKGSISEQELLNMANQCFEWVCARQQMKIDRWQSRLQMIKNTAYAWRQMVFFLSMVTDTSEFLHGAKAYFGQQQPEFVQRFGPAVSGLEVVLSGGTFDSLGDHPDGGKRFLGWTIGKHWAMPGNTQNNG